MEKKGFINRFFGTKPGESPAPKPAAPAPTRTSETVPKTPSAPVPPTPVAAAPTGPAPVPALPVRPKVQITTPEVRRMQPATHALETLSQIASALEDTPAPVVVVPPHAGAASAPDEKNKDRSLYKALLSGLYDGVLIFDERGYVIGSNTRAEQFFGYTERDLWNMSCEKLVAGISARVLMKVKSYAESGRFAVINAPCLRQDGTTFPAEIAISRINLLHTGDLIFSIRNLERREKARQRHETELDALRYAGAGIVVCKTDGLIELVNPAFVRLLRYTEEKDVLQRFFGEFCTSHETANALIKTPLDHGTWVGKLDLHTRDSKTVEVLAISSLGQKREDNPRLVITLTPLPKSVL